MTRCNSLFFCMEWTRSIGHRSDTLAFATDISDYKNHSCLNNTILKDLLYIKHPG